MKAKLLALIIATLCTSVLAGPPDPGKGAFYMAMTSMAPSESTYLFMVDQMLEARCGKPQSINHLKSLNDKGGASLFVTLELKKGDLAEAKSMLASLPCEK